MNAWIAGEVESHRKHSPVLAHSELYLSIWDLLRPRLRWLWSQLGPVPALTGNPRSFRDRRKSFPIFIFLLLTILNILCFCLYARLLC